MDAGAALKMTRSCYAELTGRRPEMETLGDYFDGKQPLAFASREWADWHKDRYVGFSDNWCGVVGSAPSERLAIGGVTLDGSTLEDSLWRDWLVNEGPMQANQGLLESLVSSTSYVLVWADDDELPTMTWEHPSQMIVRYDPMTGRRRRAALKAWVDDGWEYATLYTPDEVWKWRRKHSGVKVTNGVTENGITVVGTSHREFSPDAAWEPRETPDEVWPLPNPLGVVPVVEFPNRPRLSGKPLSEISGTKAMQDAINLLWAYLFTSADQASFPARVIMGQEPPKIPVLNSAGEKVGEKAVDLKELAHGKFLWLTGQQTTIGQWDAAKLDVFTSVIEVAVSHIAAQTRTPSHYLIATADNVPAAGYELAEAGLVEKVRDQISYFTTGIREVFRLFALVRDDKALAAQIPMAEIQWANPAIRSESQMADALLKKKQIGYPFEYILELDGVSPADRQRVMGMVRAEQTDPYLAMVGAKERVADDAEPAPVG